MDFVPKIQYTPIKVVTFGVGLYFGLKVGEKLKFNEGNWGKPYSELFENSDFGLTGSVQINLKRFFLMVGYNYGIKSVSSTNLNNGAISEAFSRNIQIGAGYFFDFKRSEK
ncbi:MAG: hypothetical protein ACI9XO_001766 [Paraglaciecola sp.]